ncbi:MAG: MATE family efflux transporter, partial [Woeseiaceae bacterium]
MEKNAAKLTDGPVGQHLLNMALPVLLGISTMMGQAFIDAYFLGMVGDRALAAHAFAFPVLMIVTSVAIGLGAGTSSVVARAIGAHDMRRARRLATDSLMLSFLITAAFCIVGVLSIEPLFLLLGAPADMIPLIRGFMLILYSGVPFVVVGMVGMASMRATGDTRLPSTLMMLGAILNVALDPVFIFGIGPIPAMGLNGAAIAALIARGLIFVGAIYLLRGRLNMISFNKPEPDELRKSWRDILHVGIPAAGTNAIVPIATAIITAMIAGYGPEAVAGFGVASRIESLALVMFYALSAVIGPFVGQNLSAHNQDRILESMRLSMLFCLGAGLSMAAVLALVSGALPT